MLRDENKTSEKMNLILAEMHRVKEMSESSTQSSNTEYYEYMKEVCNKQKNMLIQLLTTDIEKSYNENFRDSEFKAIKELHDRNKKWNIAFQKSKQTNFLDDLQSDITGCNR